LTEDEKATLEKVYATKKRIEDEVKALYPRAPNAAAPSGGAAGMTMSMADIQRTAQASGRTVEEVRAAAAARGYTVTQ
jgi:hypothetical protein